MHQNNIFTVRQAARHLGISESTLRRWTNQGSVPFLMTHGGQRRFTSQQIREIKTPLLTAAEAAREIGVSSRTLRRWADRNLAPYTMTIVGKRRFTWDNVRSIMDQMERQPALEQSSRVA